FARVDEHSFVTPEDPERQTVVDVLQDSRAPLAQVRPVALVALDVQNALLPPRRLVLACAGHEEDVLARPRDGDARVAPSVEAGLQLFGRHRLARVEITRLRIRQGQ